MGFPAVGYDNGRGKQIVYIGDPQIDEDPGNNRPVPQRIYSTSLLEKTVKNAGIQVNAIVPGDVHGAIGFVEKLISDTGGQQIMYTEVGGIAGVMAEATPKHLENQKEEMNSAVDKILSNPPPSALDTARQESMHPFRWDVPDILLQISLLAALGLAACRLGDAAMKLSVAPVFPIWLIVVLVVLAIGLRVAAVVMARRRRGRLPEGRTWLRLGMGVLAILCLGMAATRVGDESAAERPPRMTATAEETNLNVFVVIDRSIGMTADDFDGEEERLTAARTDLEVILRKYQKSRFSVISYADSARVEWPLSPDVWSLVPFIWNFTPYGGEYADDDDGTKSTNVAASNTILKDELNKAVHEYPGSANLVYIVGSGSDPGDWAFDIPQGQVSGGAVLGYEPKRAQTSTTRPTVSPAGTR